MNIYFVRWQTVQCQFAGSIIITDRDIKFNSTNYILTELKEYIWKEHMGKDLREYYKPSDISIRQFNLI